MGMDQSKKDLGDFVERIIQPGQLKIIGYGSSRVCFHGYLREWRIYKQRQDI